MSIEEIIPERDEHYLTVREVFARSHERKNELGRIAYQELNTTADSITESKMIMSINDMLRRKWLDSTESFFVEKLWKIFERHYEAHWRNETVPVGSLWNAIDAMRWEAADLTTVDNETIHLGAIPVDVLRQSLETGTIRALTQDDEHLTTSFARFIEGYTGEPVIVGNYDLDGLDKAIAEMKERHDILEQMVQEASHNIYEGRYGGGPYKKLFVPIIENINASLNEIDPRLTYDALHISDYQNTETKAVLRTLPSYERYIIEDLARYRYLASANVAESTWDKDKQQIIPLGLLDQPERTGGDNARGCAVAAFRMVYQGITGHFVGERELRFLMNMVHDEEFVIDEEYLKLLETSAFKKEYGIQVQSLQFMGMNLDAIRTIAERKKSQHNDVKIYIVANLSTASYRDSASDIAKRIQHRVVLYGSDEESVYVRDPNHPGKNEMDKQTFCYRWAITQNSGYLVIAKSMRS
jgi:hypothetical protein